MNPFDDASNASEAICDLGTNAASAIPDLELLSRDRSTLSRAGRADYALAALAGIGEPALPVLRAALADPNRLDRPEIVSAIFSMTNYKGRTNASFTLLIEALNHPDANVRQEATNALRQIAPHLITNAPAP